MKACFHSADIFLPNDRVAIDKWAVIACDQYTSQPVYWKNVEEFVGKEPSALHMIYPEVYLEEENMEKRIHNIHRHMGQYIKDGTLEKRISDGFVLVERRNRSGIRVGLVGCLDLECYDFNPQKQMLVRATEGTITSRIPPRVRIRQGAPLELPHIMLLIDDKEKKLIEPVWAGREQLESVYDAELMFDGGHITGYALTGGDAVQLNDRLYEMQENSDGFFLAVGDGNHSLATAKACWDKIKESVPESRRQEHPARYALVELVNLHEDSLRFEPIHRVVFHVDEKQMFHAFREFLHANGMKAGDGDEILFLTADSETGVRIDGAGSRLPVDVLQQFLDAYLEEHPDSRIDYVHGTEALKELSAKAGNCGIRLGVMDKESLFPAIRAGGVLPRKTFSMGEAYEKRYYIECRCVQ